MKVTSENDIRLYNFEAWSGGADRLAVLTEEQCDELESMLEDLYPDGIDETHLNDLLWFESDWIAEQLGFEDFEALEAYNDEGEKYEVWAYILNREPKFLASFDDEDDAEQWIDDNIEQEMHEFIGTDTDIVIKSNIRKDENYYTNMMDYEEEEDEDDE